MAAYHLKANAKYWFAGVRSKCREGHCEKCGFAHDEAILQECSTSDSTTSGNFLKQATNTLFF